MIRKTLKWIGISLGALLGTVVIAVLVVGLIGGRKFSRTYTVETPALTIPTDAASIAEGERLVAIRACSDCHGDNFAGDLLVDDAGFGRLYALNLTGGRTSVTADFTPADWDRAIRHGVARDGRPLIGMPSSDYYRISNRDLELMIAYLESLPPVDPAEPEPEQRVGPLLYLFAGAGLFDVPAETIDHSAAPVESVSAEVSVTYGEYLATTCTGCHQPDFSGGSLLPGLSDAAPPANLTPAGNLANWTQEGFINALRTGVTPDGKTLDPEVMPWPITLRMTDDELAAIWLYLSSLPAVETDG